MSATAMTPIKMKKNGPEPFFWADLLVAVDELVAADVAAGLTVAVDEEDEGIEDGETTPRVGTSGIETLVVKARDTLFFTARFALFFTGRFAAAFLTFFLADFLTGRLATAFFTVFLTGRFAADFLATFLTAFFGVAFVVRFAAFFAATGMTPYRVTFLLTSLRSHMRCLWLPHDAYSTGR